MTPVDFLEKVVRPNAADARRDPNSLRMASNALLSLDALAGMVFWYLHDRGDANVTRYNDDSAFKAELAKYSMDFRIIRDAAFALKHGRLTRQLPRPVESPDQFEQNTNVLGFFRAGDKLGGSLLYLNLRAGPVSRVAVRDLIGSGLRFLEQRVGSLP
ncbi:MAG: hypothetical protein JO038_00510 [Alphaproteobacteria bacterium]|nr:hypothetical protein [Alphaproteobacteria bacterium]